MTRPASSFFFSELIPRRESKQVDLGIPIQMTKNGPCDVVPVHQLGNIRNDSSPILANPWPRDLHWLASNTHTTDPARACWLKYCHLVKLPVIWRCRRALGKVSVRWMPILSFWRSYRSISLQNCHLTDQGKMENTNITAKPFTFDWTFILTTSQLFVQLISFSTKSFWGR